MKKLVLLSIVLASIAIPARMARMKNGQAALRKALVHMLLFDVVYVVLLLYVWPRLH